MRTANQKTFQSICDWYLKKIITSPDYFNKNAVKSTDLLLPEFKSALDKANAEFNKKYPEVEIVYVETFRSNSRQLMHYNNGASKIRTNGMHHYGIAVDAFFRLDKDGDGDTELTYEGDYKFLRQCWDKQDLILLGEWDKGHAQFIQVPEQTELRRQVDYAIREFQTKYRLTRDGIVGNKTINKAREVYGK
jgi:hypothetical protein